MTRNVFRITGADTQSFLQGLITNDIAKLAQGLVYAAILTPQGKYLADFFLVPDQNGVLLDIGATIAPAVVQRLNMYKLRADVVIDQTDLQVYRSSGAQPEGGYADTRHPDLGWRSYGAEAGDDGTDFDAIRVARCVPETGIELLPDTFILEAGFERLQGVDFRKGCYVGQEVTARMKHKTELRKGLAKIDIEGQVPLGTQITANDKQVGTVFTQSGGQAIAYLRFDRAGKDMEANGVRVRYAAQTPQ